MICCVEGVENEYRERLRELVDRDELWTFVSDTTEVPDILISTVKGVGREKFRALDAILRRRAGFTVILSDRQGILEELCRHRRRASLSMIREMEDPMPVFRQCFGKFFVVGT